MEYFLLDSGNQKKIEKFGSYTIVRPCSQAIWKPKQSSWNRPDATFTREKKGGWSGNLPKYWNITCGQLTFKIAPTDFGHLGIFPEHKEVWEWGVDKIAPGDKVLNLFAYSGGATLAFAKAGAKVCHVDASKGMVSWARENAKLNDLDSHPIRWIVDDVIKFLQREIKRGNQYDGILLDPPSFGRGSKGEVFKIERDLRKLLSLCKQVLSDCPKFLICTNHTNEITPTVLEHLFSEHLDGPFESGELLLHSENGMNVPTGSFVRWASC